MPNDGKPKLDPQTQRLFEISDELHERSNKAIRDANEISKSLNRFLTDIEDRKRALRYGVASPDDLEREPAETDE